MAQKRSEPRYMCAELVNILICHEDQTVEEAIAPVPRPQPTLHFPNSAITPSPRASVAPAALP